MRRPPTHARGSRGLILGLLSIALIACRSADSAADQPRAAVSASEASAQPIATPTPSPSPPTPDEALRAHLDERDGMLFATFTATERSRDTVDDLAGFYYTEGRSFWLSVQSSASQRPQPVERIQYRTQGFERAGEGRWYATENIEFDGSLATLIKEGAWTDEVRPGWFAPARPMDMSALAAAIGALPADLTLEDAQEVSGDIAVQIARHGELLAVEVNLEIVDLLSETSEPAHWSFDFTFHPDADRIPVTRPEEAWRREVLGIMAMVEVPFEFERFEVEDHDGDLFAGPYDEELGFDAYPSEARSLAENAQSFIDYLASADGLGVPMELDEPVEVGGGVTVLVVGDDGQPDEPAAPEGRLVATHVTQGVMELYYAAAVTQRGDAVYVIHWYGWSDGSEDKQLQLFREIVSTFRPLR